MTHLVDRIFVVAFDEHAKIYPTGTGPAPCKILCRFPHVKDSELAGYLDVCQPEGWTIASRWSKPLCFVFRLTDELSQSSYIVILSFREPFSPGDDSRTFFVPKCLAVITKFQEHIEVVKSCLKTIYSIFLDGASVELETLIGNLMGAAYVPRPGGAKVKFSLGAGDRHEIQPRQSDTVPATRCKVFDLVRRLGIHNTIQVICAVLTEMKVVVISESISIRSDTIDAILALIHAVIPILPENFSAHVFSMLFPSLIGYSSHSKLPQDACSVLHPDIATSDDAYPDYDQSNCKKNPEFEDKQIRACFLRVLTDLMMDYRACLQFVRVLPTPTIEFNAAAFLGLRNFMDDSFMLAFVESQSFSAFIRNRGIPYRTCDIFDDLYAEWPRILLEENNDVSGRMMKINLISLAERLLRNENGSAVRSVAPKMVLPSKGALAVPSESVFPAFDPDRVMKVYNDVCTKIQPDLTTAKTGIGSPQRKLVPFGIRPCYSLEFSVERKLDVLKRCLKYLFDKQYSEFRKMKAAVSLSMQNSTIRACLCQELRRYKTIACEKGRATEPLEIEQFKYLSELMSDALKYDTQRDAYGVAYSLMDLSAIYFTRITKNVDQYAYTRIQNQMIWQNKSFWKTAFYHDLHNMLKLTYDEHINVQSDIPDEGIRDTWNLFSQPCGIEVFAKRLSEEKVGANEREENERLKQHEQTIAARISGLCTQYTGYMLNLMVPLNEKQMDKMVRDSHDASNNGSTVSKHTSADESDDSSDLESGFIDTKKVSNPISLNLITSTMSDICSQIGVDYRTVDQLTLKITELFPQHTAYLKEVNAAQSKLQQGGQRLEEATLHLLHSNEVSLMRSPMSAFLLPDGREEHHPQMHDEQCFHKVLEDNLMLPAEGQLFLTNYRLVFMGRPCDPFLSELSVIRWIPLMTITKERKLEDQKVGIQGLIFTNCLLVRSVAFQLMKVGFKHTTTMEDIEYLRTMIAEYRWSENLRNVLALRNHSPQSQIDVYEGGKAKKYHTLKIKNVKKFGRATLGKISELPWNDSAAAGTTHGHSGSPPKGVVRNRTDSLNSHGLYGSDDEDSPSNSFTMTKSLQNVDRRFDFCDYRRLGLGGDHNLDVFTGAKPFGSMVHQTQVAASRDHKFRLTSANRSYGLCKSYPAVFAVPGTVADSSLKRIAKCHLKNRFPVITWKSEKYGALIIRGAGFTTKSVKNRFKHQKTMMRDMGNRMTSAIKGRNATDNALALPLDHSPNQYDSSNSIATVTGPDWSTREEHTGYICKLSAFTFNPKNITGSEESLLSIGSLLSDFDSFSLADNATPSISNKHLRASGSKKSISSPGPVSAIPAYMIGSQKRPSLASPPPSTSYSYPVRPFASAPPPPISETSATLTFDQSSFTLSREPSQRRGLHRAPLYIFCERGQEKSMEPNRQLEFVPIDNYVSTSEMAIAMKKFMKIVVPPIQRPCDDGKDFLEQIHETEWLQLIRKILRVACDVVNVVEIQRSSVAICFENGWEFTAQISSLSQIFLDPYYRTFDGFKTLIEKEWLAFGYRYTHRCIHTRDSEGKKFAPVFLLFLDCVHQTMLQYDSAFEFNDYYLQYLAYHSTVCYFQTFLFNSEYERLNFGTSMAKSIPFNSSSPENGFALQPNYQPCIWDYIDSVRQKSPHIFNNLRFLTLGNANIYAERTLRPIFHLAIIDVWNYYTVSDPLGHGSAYDLESEEMQRQIMRPDSASEECSVNRNVDAYRDTPQLKLMPNIVQLLEEITSLRRDLGKPSADWRQVLGEGFLELEKSGRKVHCSSELSVANKNIHKTFTIQTILKGRAASQVFRHGGNKPHEFEPHPLISGACDTCSKLFLGSIGQVMKCTNCGYKCHERCSTKVGDTCIGVGLSNAMAVAQQATTPTAMPSSSDDIRTKTTTLPTSTGYVTQQRISYEGMLHKRANNILKPWIQRWYVLDSYNHEIRYFEDRESSHRVENQKGVINLRDMLSISSVVEKSGCGYFDLKMNKRTYNFCASSSDAARQWIENIVAVRS